MSLLASPVRRFEDSEKGPGPLWLWQVPGQSDFLCLGKAAFLLPNLGTSLGKSLLVNGVETCVSGEAWPAMLHCRCQSQRTPHWAAYFPHWVSADAHVVSEFLTSRLGREACIFVWIFQAGEWQVGCWTYLA